MQSVWSVSLEPGLQAARCTYTPCLQAVTGVNALPQLVRFLIVFAGPFLDMFWLPSYFCFYCFLLQVMLLYACCSCCGRCVLHVYS